MAVIPNRFGSVSWYSQSDYEKHRFGRIAKHGPQEHTPRPEIAASTKFDCTTHARATRTWGTSVVLWHRRDRL